MGFSARGAVAGTPEAAAALARVRDGAIVPSGEEERALRPLPVSALGVGPGVVEGLARLGLSRIEDVALRAPRALSPRAFGADLIAPPRRRLRPHPLRHRRGGWRRRPYVVERRFFEPILTQEDVSRARWRALAEGLAAMLTRHGEGARALGAFTVSGRRGGGGASASARARPTRPGADGAALRERLAGERDELGHRLGLRRGAADGALRRPPRRGARRLDGAVAGEDLARLVDALGARARTGAGAQRSAPAIRNWPEDAAAARAPGTPPPQDAHGEPVPWTPPLPAAPADRPIRLFSRPEPIEAVATVPDGPPLRFRWRRVLHEDRRLRGPRAHRPRLVGRRGPHTATIFRAEDVDGRRFWLFREGLYGREVASPRWYVHGLFG